MVLICGGYLTYVIIILLEQFLVVSRTKLVVVGGYYPISVVLWNR